MAAPSSPGRGREDARSPVMMSAPSRKRRRRSRLSRPRTLRFAVSAAAVLVFGAVGASPAAAASPWWHLTSGSRPSDLPEKAGGKGELILTAANFGDAPVDGEAEPVTIEDALPAALKARATPTAVAGHVSGVDGAVTCTKAPLRCSFAGTLPPYDLIEVRIKVETLAGAHSGAPNEVTVSGGGAPLASLSRPLAFSGQPVPFGVEDYALGAEEEGGGEATQAGSHPFQLSTTITLDQSGAGENPVSEEYETQLAAMPKDVRFHWPAGLLGNPAPLPRCTLAQFLTLKAAGGGEDPVDICPDASAVGVSTVTYDEPKVAGVDNLAVPIFNLEPAAGEPARFGFYLNVGAIPVLIDPALRSEAREGKAPDYGIDVNVDNISQVAALLSSQATVWGTPADPSHDNSRGWGCLFAARHIHVEIPCETPSPPAHPPAFLTLPTSCSGARLQTEVEADSWAEPLSPTLPLASNPPLPRLDGCNRLPFKPEIDASPTSDAATSPTGLSFDLSFHDEGLLHGEAAQSQLKKAVVTLPVGFTTNPSVAEGLKACSLREYEEATVQLGSGCNPESKIGDVQIESPLIAVNANGEVPKVTGGLYVAKQGDNPNGNLLTLYLIARSEELGILVRQALKVTPDPLTGQLTTEVDNAPQLPFSHFHLSFRQGQRSPLITPPACGEYTVKALLYPWSQPETPVERTSSFQITQGPEGLPCPSGGVPPFHPNLLAGSINPTAGAFSPFYTDITRRDSEQEITHFSIKLPPGVSGKLAGVPYCSDAQIAAAKAREHEGGGGEEEASPSCPANSQIGRSDVGSGVGNVLAYAPGKLYLAGPYHGSNLSIVSITVAKVGPFDLGTVVVRFALRINPETAEVFVDSQGSDPIPHIVDGIPVHLRDVQATVDRNEFTLNPTSCDPTSTASTVLGSGLNFASEADDQPVTVSSRFQVGSCASLGFKPKLSLSLIGGTKRGQNPKLKAVLNARPGDANVGSAQVTLPHSEFLDNAHIKTVCTRVVFAQGSVPGEKCPADSIYGFAKAVTPILAEPLEGPVYLRSSSHQLPDLVAALHNNQVDIALDGHVEGVKGGIRNTFEAVPDAPVTKFTLEMQGGNKGLLENSTNLCTHTHRATSDFTGHNGKVYDTRPVLQAKCGGKAKKGKAHKHRSAH